jgi:hypothetical protein
MLLGVVAVATGCEEGNTSGADGGRDAKGDVPAQPADAQADQLPPDVKPGDAPADGGTDADGGGDALEAAPPLTSAHSFETVATLTLSAKGPGAGPPIGPVKDSLMVRLDPVARTVIVGQAGNAIEVGVRERGAGVFETTASFTLSLRVTTACAGANVQVTALTITVAGAGLLTAAGQGEANVIFGDVAYRYDVAVELSGGDDNRGPSLGPEQPAIDPLGGVSLTANEPLPGTAAARLILGTEKVDLKATRAAGLVVSFGGPEGPLALRYGSSYQLEVDAWRDLAQNPGLTLPKLTTLDPPALIPEDGFESAGASLGGATVVQSPYPVIAGQKSVLVTPSVGWFGQPSRRFTARLARMGNDAVVRVTVRPIAGLSPTVGTYGTKLRIAVPGGAIVEAKLPPFESLPTQVASLPAQGTVYVGPARTIELPLPPMAGPEIVFDLSTESAGCGLLAPTAGYLLDDLRID